MISSQILSELNADGDHKNFTEEFFFHSHPFNDLILVVQDKQLYVDKSVLAASSKVFQSYFQNENIDSIEILDITPNEMIELLQFLYPQFQCTINNQNITILLILANRFELNFISSACRTFILVYLSKFKSINMYEQEEDGIRLSILSILEILCIWFREFLFINDMIVCEAILNKLVQCKIENILASKGFMDLEEKIQWKIFQARAKYLEQHFNNQTNTFLSVKY
jgi:hypothetical protein